MGETNVPDQNVFILFCYNGSFLPNPKNNNMCSQIDSSPSLQNGHPWKLHVALWWFWDWLHLFAIVCNYLQLFAFVCNCLQLFAIFCNYLQLFAMGRLKVGCRFELKVGGSRVNWKFEVGDWSWKLRAEAGAVSSKMKEHWSLSPWACNISSAWFQQDLSCRKSKRAYRVQSWGSGMEQI